jgi:hypothetical protein
MASTGILFDQMIAKLPVKELAALDTRYGALTLEPRKVKFIDRNVADSRDVALNHTAGLSLPQPVMMSLFSLAELMDTTERYLQACGVPITLTDSGGALIMASCSAGCGRCGRRSAASPSPPCGSSTRWACPSLSAWSA